MEQVKRHRFGCRPALTGIKGQDDGCGGHQQTEVFGVCLPQGIGCADTHRDGFPRLTGTVNDRGIKVQFLPAAVLDDEKLVETLAALPQVTTGAPIVDARQSVNTDICDDLALATVTGGIRRHDAQRNHVPAFQCAGHDLDACICRFPKRIGGTREELRAFGIHADTVGCRVVIRQLQGFGTVYPDTGYRFCHRMSDGIRHRQGHADRLPAELFPGDGDKDGQILTEAVLADGIEECRCQGIGILHRFAFGKGEFRRTVNPDRYGIRQGVSERIGRYNGIGHDCPCRLCSLYALQGDVRHDVSKTILKDQPERFQCNAVVRFVIRLCGTREDRCAVYPHREGDGRRIALRVRRRQRYLHRLPGGKGTGVGQGDLTDCFAEAVLCRGTEEFRREGIGCFDRRLVGVIPKIGGAIESDPGDTDRCHIPEGIGRRQNHRDGIPGGIRLFLNGNGDRQRPTEGIRSGRLPPGCRKCLSEVKPGACGICRHGRGTVNLHLKAGSFRRVPKPCRARAQNQCCAAHLFAVKHLDGHLHGIAVCIRRGNTEGLCRDGRVGAHRQLPIRNDNIVVRPFGIQRDILRRHGREGIRGLQGGITVPACKTLSGKGRCFGCRDGRPVVLRHGCYCATAIGHEGKGIPVQPPMGGIRTVTETPCYNLRGEDRLFSVVPRPAKEGVANLCRGGKRQRVALYGKRPRVAVGVSPTVKVIGDGIHDRRPDRFNGYVARKRGINCSYRFPVDLPGKAIVLSRLLPKGNLCVLHCVARRESGEIDKFVRIVGNRISDGFPVCRVGQVRRSGRRYLYTQHRRCSVGAGPAEEAITGPLRCRQGERRRCHRIAGGIGRAVVSAVQYIGNRIFDRRPDCRQCDILCQIRVNRGHLLPIILPFLKGIIAPGWCTQGEGAAGYRIGSGIGCRIRPTRQDVTDPVCHQFPVRPIGLISHRPFRDGQVLLRRVAV